MKKAFILFSILALFASCGLFNDKPKNTINEKGEMVGKTATEFIEGVSDGVEKALATNVVLSEELMTKGITIGNSEIRNDTMGNENNLFQVYIMFDKDFSDTFLLKAYDENDIEIGRSKKVIQAKKNDAEYYDFVFNEKTKIESKSKISIY